MAFAITACSPTSDTETTDESVLPGVDDTQGTTGAAGDAGLPSVADLVSEPERYAGQTVTVEGDVDEVFGAMAFALDEDSAFEGGIDNDLLVLSRQAGSLEPIDDQWMDNRVRVVGTVGRMPAAEAEKELGWELTPELRTQFDEAEAVLIADSVTRIED
jgi:hypothetical protein